MRAVWICSVFVAAAGLSACGDCDVPSDCPAGDVCSAGTCVPIAFGGTNECSINADCVSEGFEGVNVQCVAGRCIRSNPPTGGFTPITDMGTGADMGGGGSDMGNGGEPDMGGGGPDMGGGAFAEFDLPPASWDTASQDALYAPLDIGGTNMVEPFGILCTASSPAPASTEPKGGFPNQFAMRDAATILYVEGSGSTTGGPNVRRFEPDTLRIRNGITGDPQFYIAPTDFAANDPVILTCPPDGDGNPRNANAVFIRTSTDAPMAACGNMTRRVFVQGNDEGGVDTVQISPQVCPVPLAAGAGRVLCRDRVYDENDVETLFTGELTMLNDDTSGARLAPTGAGFWVLRNQGGEVSRLSVGFDGVVAVEQVFSDPLPDDYEFGTDRDAIFDDDGSAYVVSSSQLQIGKFDATTGGTFSQIRDTTPDGDAGDTSPGSCQSSGIRMVRNR